MIPVWTSKTWEMKGELAAVIPWCCLQPRLIFLLAFGLSGLTFLFPSLSLLPGRRFDNHEPPPFKQNKLQRSWLYHLFPHKLCLKMFTVMGGEKCQLLWRDLLPWRGHGVACKHEGTIVSASNVLGVRD